MEPAPVAEENPPSQPDLRRWAVIGLIALIVVVIAAVSLPGLLASAPGGSTQPILTVPETTPVPTALETLPTPGIPTTAATPGVTETPPAAEDTTAPVETATPCIPAGEPGFTVTVSPVETTAARGTVVNYRMAIEAQNCFSENVSMKLTANVLFFRQTYDLGTQTAPYPKTFDYRLTVPDSLFPGATVNGVVTSTGDDITRENQLTLHVQ